MECLKDEKLEEAGLIHKIDTLNYPRGQSTTNQETSKTIKTFDYTYDWMLLFWAMDLV